MMLPHRRRLPRLNEWEVKAYGRLLRSFILTFPSINCLNFIATFSSIVQERISSVLSEEKKRVDHEWDCVRCTGSIHINTGILVSNLSLTSKYLVAPGTLS